MSAELARPEAALDAAPATRAGAGALGLAILSLTVGPGFALRGVLAPVQEAARQALGFSDGQMGLLQGLAAAIPIALLSLPLSRLVDRTNRVRLLIALSLVTAVGGLLSAVAHGFTLMFVARMMAGAGGLCALPAAISVAADISRPQSRGRSLLLLSLGQYVGTALAFALGGALLGRLQGAPALFGLEPWRAVMLVFGVAGVVLTLPLLALREPARHEVGEAADAPLGPVLRELWTCRAFLLPLVVGQMSAVMADTAAAIWAAPVLARSYGLSPGAAGGSLGLVVLGAGFLGSLVGGFAADLGQRSKGSGLLAGAMVAAALALPAALFAIAPSPGVFFALLALLLICGATAGLVTTTALAVLIPNELRGVCLGLFVVVGGVVGFAIAPSLVSLVSDAFGGGRHLAPALASVDVGVGLCSLAGFVVASLNRPRGRQNESV